jgi:hypothetical protein
VVEDAARAVPASRSVSREAKSMVHARGGGTPPPAAAAAAAAGTGAEQGLTLVHFSAHRKRFLCDRG